MKLSENDRRVLKERLSLLNSHDPYMDERMSDDIETLEESIQALEEQLRLEREQLAHLQDELTYRRIKIDLFKEILDA